MTTRRTIIKSMPALALAPAVFPVSLAAAPLTRTDRPEQLHVWGMQGGTLLRIGREVDPPVTFRNWGIDRESDGSWLITASMPNTEEGGGSIEIYDPQVITFLEEFYKLMEDPDTYGNVEI